MSLIAEILKASATKATSVVVDAQTRITLGVGDLLKLPQGTNVQTLRQVTDLVVIIDNGDGLPPDRVVVQGFFAAGSLGMVQIGEDGAAEMVTPRSEVAQVPASVAPNTPAAPAEAPVVAAEQDGGRVQAQVFQDLAVNDAQGTMFVAAEATEATTELVDVLDGSGVAEAPLEIAGVSEFNFGFETSVANLEPPVVFAPTDGPWINFADKQAGYTVGGQGIDGMLVEVQFLGSSGQKVSLRTPVVGGQWSVKLNGQQIETLGEGGVALAATHLSQAGQAFSPANLSSLFIDTLLPQVPTLQASTAIANAVATNSWLNANDVADKELTITVRTEPGSTLVLTLQDEPDDNDPDTPTRSIELTGVADGNGRYVFDIKPSLTSLGNDGLFKLKDGPILYRVDAKDAAGNTSSSIEPSFSLHQALPANPLAGLRREADNDTGRSQLDGITSDTTPLFDGKVETVAGKSSAVKVLVYRDVWHAGSFNGIPSPEELEATITLVNGTFSYSANLAADAPTLWEGKQYQFLFVAEDAYGNRSAPQAVPITLDTLARSPSLDTVASDDKLSYTETLAATINFAGDAEPFSSVELTFNLGNEEKIYRTTNANAAGRWSIDVPSNPTGPEDQAGALRNAFGGGFNGFVSVAVRQTDLAGNASESVARPIYIRTEPLDQVSSLGLVTGQDTGSGSNDGIINLTRFQVTGAGPASDFGKNNMVVRIYSDTNNNGSVDEATDVLLAELTTNENGIFSGKVPADEVTLPGGVVVPRNPLGDGTYKLISVVYDTLSGTTSTSTDISQRLQVQVDTQVEPVTFNTIAGNDVVTSDEFQSGFLVISGRGEAGARVKLKVGFGTSGAELDNILVDGNGNWNAQIPKLVVEAWGEPPEGFRLKASQTDVAGNVSEENIEPKLFWVKLGELDAPTNLRLVAEDDTGRPGRLGTDGDGFTAKGTGLRFAGNAAEGHIVKLFNDLNNNGAVDPGEQLGASFTVGSGGTFEIQTDLPVGVYNVRAQAFNVDGQSSGATVPYSIYVDQSAAAPEVEKVAGDDIINFIESQNGVANFTGKSESQAELDFRFLRDGDLVFEKTNIVSGTNDRWSINLSLSEVQALQLGASPNSVFKVQTRQTDKAGNVSGWSERTFEIDTAAPSASNSANNDAAAMYNNDALRAWRSPTGTDPVIWSEAFGFQSGMTTPKELIVAVGLMADVKVGDTVKLRWGGETVSRSVTGADVERGYALVGVFGDMINRNRTNSGSDAVNVRATFVDVAGNESDFVDVILGMQVTLAGNPPTFAPLGDAYNSIETSGGFTTFYSNRSSQSSDLNKREFLLNGRAGGSERLIVFNDVNLDGVAQDSEILLARDPDTGVPIPVEANEAGNYSVGLSLPSGSYNLRVIPTASPNASPSEVVRVVIDTLAPLAPVLSSPVISGGYVGANERDNVNASGVELTGTGEPGATINVQLVNLTTNVVGSVVRDVSVSELGQWRAPVGVVQWGQVGDGTISVRVSQTDRAGNTSTTYTTVNGQPPTVVFDSVVLAPTVDAVTGDDMLKKSEVDAGLTFTGSGEHLRGPGLPATIASITFVGGSGTLGPFDADINEQGKWQYYLNPSQLNSLGDGLLSINVIQIDPAGNRSEATSRVVIIDRQANAPQVNFVATDNAINAGERDNGVTIDGNAEGGASVEVRLTRSDLTVLPIKTDKALENGYWSVKLSSAEINSLVASGQGAFFLEVRQIDKAGNTSNWSQLRSIAVVTAPLTPGVTVDAVTGDNQIVVAEQAQTVLLAGGGPPNTSLQLSLVGVRGTVSRVLTVDPITGRWSTELTTDVMQNVLGAGAVTVKAYAVNSMQQSTASMEHTFTIEVLEPSPTFSRVSSDNYVNAAEAGAPLVLDGGGVPDHLVELEFTGSGNNAIKFTRSATVSTEDRKWQIVLSVGDMAALQNGTVNVLARQKASAAPNAATSIDAPFSFVIDTVAPNAPNVADASNAGAYNSTLSELKDGVTVAEASDGVFVAVALPSDAVAGDRFVLRWGSQEVAQAITAAMVPSQGARVAYVQVPAGILVAQGDGTFDISVVFSDIAGNTRPLTAVVSGLVVKAPPNAPSVNTIYADGYINALEFGGIQSAGTAEIRGNAADGGTVRVTLVHESGGTLVLPDIQVTAGAWTARPTAGQLLSMGEGRIFINAVYTNATGAVSAVSQADFTFDKSVPLVPQAGSANALLAGEANARNELAGGLIRNDAALSEEEQKTEAANPILVNVALAKSDAGVNDVKSGDTLTLLWGDTQQVNAIVTEADLARGFAQVLVNNFVMSSEGDSDDLKVRARITDKAGNVGADYLVWRGKVDAIPLTPEVNAVSVDSFLNASEANAWQVTGQGQLGGRVVVTLQGTKKNPDGSFVTIVSEELPVLLDPLTNVYRWKWDGDADDVTKLGQGRIKITSVQYDQNNNASDAGKNPSDPSIRYFDIDTNKPLDPTINVISGNDRISLAEGKSTVPISGTGESGTKVEVTISRPNKPTVVKLGDVTDNKWSVDLLPDELTALGGGNDFQVTVKLRDLALNESNPVSRNFSYTTAEVPVPSFTSVTGITAGPNAAYFNVADLPLLATENFTIRGTASASAVDALNRVRLTVKTGSGSSLIFIINVDTEGNWSKAFTREEFDALGQGEVNLTAVLVKPDLDESVEGSFAPFTIDTDRPTLAAATVSADGLNGNAKEGDVISVTVQASESLAITGIGATPPSLALDFGSGPNRNAVYNAVRTAAAGADKLVFTYVVQAGDSADTIQAASIITLNGASIADAAGNQPTSNTIVSVPSSSLRVDTIVPAKPSILSVDDEQSGGPGQMPDNTNKVNFAEAQNGVNVRVKLDNDEGNGTKARAGDTVELLWTVNGISTPITKVITESDVTAREVTVTISQQRIGTFDGTATLKVRLRDVAGNESGFSVPPDETVDVDTLVPGTLGVNSWLGDDKVNKLESDSVNLDLTMRGDLVEAGASVSVVLQQGPISFSLTPVLNYVDGTWTISSAQMREKIDTLGDGAFTVTRTQTDVAGNVGASTTATYFIDRSVPNRPAISAIPSNSDGWINLRDAQIDGVRVTVSLLNTNAVAGDTLVIGGFTNDIPYTLLPSDITNQSATVLLPSGDVLQNSSEAAAMNRSISARIRDQGGNESALSNPFSVNIDTNIAKPEVDKTVGAAAGITKLQATAPVDFWGFGAEVGAQVSVFFTGVLGSTLLSKDTGRPAEPGLPAGWYKVTLQPNDMITLGDGLVSYRVVQTDAALNTSIDEVGSFDLRLSTPVPTLLSVTEDNVVSEDDSKSTIKYKGLGVPGLQVELEFYIRNANGVYQDTPAIAKKTATVATSDSANLKRGEWVVDLTPADIIALTPNRQGTVMIKAVQIELGATPALNAKSGEADLEFYADRLKPTLLAGTNLFSYSQNFDNAAWAKTGATVQTNVATPEATAPDGTQTAEALVPNFGSVRPFVNQVAPVTAGQYTYSVYLKNGTSSQPWVEMSTSGDATRRFWFNTSTGDRSDLTNTTMTPVGDGWWRATASFTVASSTNSTFSVGTAASSGSTGNITGDGIRPSVLLWGAQLELGSTPTAYQKNDSLPSLSLFDGNGDGANNDGLLVTFAEPVAVDPLTNPNLIASAFTVTGTKSLGRAWRVEAVDGSSINGTFYATKFKVFIDMDGIEDGKVALVAGDEIRITASSIRDAGGNAASVDQILRMPNISVPGLPTPPVDIMSDNRINLEESSDVRRLIFTDTNTPAQLFAARGGLIQTSVETKVDGVVQSRLVDEVLPVANFLTMDLTFNKAARLLQGQAMQANVRVTYLDNTSEAIALFTTGTASTQANATNTYRFTSARAVNLANIKDVAYDNFVDRGRFMVPQTVDPTGARTSGILISTTGSIANGNLETTVKLTLDFPNMVRLANGVKSTARMWMHFTDTNTWAEITTFESAAGTNTTATTGTTRLEYTYKVNRPINPNANFFWDVVPTGLTLDPDITVITSGVNAPVVTTAFDTSVVVKTSDRVSGDATSPVYGAMTTELLDQNLVAIPGSRQQNVAYTQINPNRVLYTQSLADALAASGRKLQLYVDGKPIGSPTTMGIDEVTLRHWVAWENQFGNSTGWSASHSLQAGAKVTALLTVTFKPVQGVIPPPAEVLVTATGGTNVNVDPLTFTGAFIRTDTGQKIESSTVASITYKANSISQNFPNEVIRQTEITTSQFVNLPSSAWQGEEQGLKQITAQITTVDGSLTSVFSAPKQIRLDQKVGGITDVSFVSHGTNAGNDSSKLDAGDTIQIRFEENVQFTYSALPTSFGANVSNVPVGGIATSVTPVGGENGFAQIWNVRLGTGASIPHQQNFGFTLEARKVFDQSGNDNGTGQFTPTVGTVPATLLSKAGPPVIDNVSDDNVVSNTLAPTEVWVNLTNAKQNDKVRLLIDGVEVVNEVTVGADGQARVKFDVAGNLWGADGERRLTTEIYRPSTNETVKSNLRSVYVASDTSHWSQESTYAGKVHWFDPDAIIQADGATVVDWKASAGGLTVRNSVANTRTVKIVDVLTGHAHLVTDANSVFLETTVGGVSGVYAYQPPTMENPSPSINILTAGFTDFSMFKPVVAGSQTLMAHPYIRYTSNSTTVTYKPGNNPAANDVSVAAWQPLWRNQTLSYSFTGGNSTVRMYDWRGWDSQMANVISTGSWQMVTQAAAGLRTTFYNQMTLNRSDVIGSYVPGGTETYVNFDYNQATRASNPNSDLLRFRIGGGIGILGDQISVSVATNFAYQQEIGAYLGAKYQSTGSVRARNADSNNNSYDLSISNVPGTLIDQNLMLADKLSNDIVTTAGADYVNTGLGSDEVRIKDFAFRHIDAGGGIDKLTLAEGFTGRSVFNLSDFASNYRGLSGSSSDNQRVNDAGYHRLLGFEKIDLVQHTFDADGKLVIAPENRRQVMTVSANDVKSLTETGVLEVALGKEDVLKATGFAIDRGVEGVYQYNGEWYDRKYSQVIGDQVIDRYTKGGDRMPEVVSFKSVAALNQVQLAFDHAMTGGSVLGGHFTISTFPSSSLSVQFATAVNLKQGVALTLSASLDVAAKITYNESASTATDDAGRGFRHNTWILGTNSGDTLSDANLSASEKARGVTFMGGTGVDSITGTSGADLIIGGLGGDVLTGGLGSDTFLYRNEITGSGGAGSLGGTSGDVITDFTFNHTNPANNDRIDLSWLFESNFVATGNAAADAKALVEGGFLDLRNVTNLQTGKQDLEIWVDRDGKSSGGGGSLYGQLVTVADGVSNLPTDRYPSVDNMGDEQFLTRLLEEGRLVVSHF